MLHSIFVLNAETPVGVSVVSYADVGNGTHAFMIMQIEWKCTCGEILSDNDYEIQFRLINIMEIRLLVNNNF